MRRGRVIGNFMPLLAVGLATFCFTITTTRSYFRCAAGAMGLRIYLTADHFSHHLCDGRCSIFSLFYI